MEAFIPERQELAKKLRTQYADAKLGDIKVSVSHSHTRESTEH